METLPATFYSINNCTVLILPMRNGNLQLFLKAIQTHLRSYPTYEEWKHWISYFITDYVGFVLILPMRNGNLLWPPIKGGYRGEFLSYLWGMETLKYSLKATAWISGSYPTYEEWKLIYGWYNIDENKKVLILPMRNGNWVAISTILANIQGSYPTYEEWKLLFFPLKH